MDSSGGRRFEAHRRLARSLLWGLGAMGLLSLVGPLLSYTIDTGEAQRQLRSRGAHEARVLADSMALRILTMEAELRRIAQRPEVNFADQSLDAEKILLQHTHERSALFSGGLALLDLKGMVVSAMPAGLFTRPGGYSPRRWFQKALSSGGRTIVERFGDELDGWVLLVPVRDRGSVVGFIAGVARAADQELALGLNATQRVAFTEGEQVLFSLPNVESIPRAVLARRAEARAPAGLDIYVDGTRYLAFEARVLGRLELWVLTRFDEVLAPIRGRLVDQLVFLVAVQLISWLAFALFVRHTYLGFRALERRITEEEKMAKLGVAASLIAHEVKNTLNGVSAAMSAGLGRGAEQELFGRVVRSQLARLSHVARSLLALGRPVRPRLGEVRLDQVVRETVESLRVLPEIGSVELRAELEEPVTVDADPALAAAAADNVVRNAVEAAVAAKDVGRITEARVNVACVRRDPIAELVVEDNGGGPPDDFEEHAFEPFVTSKPKGIGLGLTTTRQSMEAMGGAVRFERIPGGSRFVLRFRLRREEEAAT